MVIRSKPCSVPNYQNLCIFSRRTLVNSEKASVHCPGWDTWDAFELANSSLELHGRDLSGGQPRLFGDRPPPFSHLDLPKESEEDAPLIQIFDDETELRLLICAEAGAPETSSLQAVEVALASLLAIEVRGMRLIHRISAPPPPSAAATFACGVVTMRCDLCTSSSARISLVVSGSAQTCFADHFLETTIKKGLVEKSQSLRLVLLSEDNKNMEIRRSISIACGAAVIETRAKVPSWAAQALRQLSTDISYKPLVALGIAGIDGAPVAAFQREDAERLAMLRKDPSPTSTAPAPARERRPCLPACSPVVKKHNCSRPPILECPEEEFLNDVVQFLVSRGHGRLIPPTGIEAFPDVVLNGKRLDLYNLYREVVSRGWAMGSTGRVKYFPRCGTTRQPIG